MRMALITVILGMVVSRAAFGATGTATNDINGATPAARSHDGFHAAVLADNGVRVSAEPAFLGALGVGAGILLMRRRRDVEMFVF